MAAAFELGDALVGDLEVGGGLDQAVVAAVEQVLAERLEPGRGPGRVVRTLVFLAAVGLGEAALERLVLLAGAR